MNAQDLQKALISNFACVKQTDPQAEFFRIYGWLIKIYGCFLAKPQNWGEGNLWLKILNLWLLFGKAGKTREKLQHKIIAVAKFNATQM